MHANIIKRRPADSGPRPTRRWRRPTAEELGVPESGPADRDRRSCAAARSIPDEEKRGGGSDDIGDISWNVPTVTLRYPGEHPGRARPQLGQRDRDGDADRAQRRHRRRAGAGDDRARSADAARARRRRRGTTSATCRPRTKTYTPLIRPEDKPAIWLNKETMAKYREQMKKDLLLRPGEVQTYSISWASSTRRCGR